jgi:hypothetical protein
MPANTPRWPDELPVNMTEADYRALLDATYDITEIREFHLDAAASTYRLHAIHRSVLDLEQPVRLTLPVSELVTT